MSDHTPTDFDKARAEYLAACARAFDLDTWLDAKALRAEFDRRCPER